MDYQPTIGLEIHAELKTRTKMFCDSLNDPDEKHPNTNVCPVCLGHPGTLPTINKAAVEAVLKVGLALGGKINKVTKFDRKNYFYPDLPKGYQISQYDEPLVEGGELLGKRIRRIHLEEDAGNLVHDNKTRSSLVDFNRVGVPLMELVTEPDFTSAEEVVAFARELQLILRYLGASDADMERGQMRIEANVSLNMGTKTELKNINSFRFVAEAVAYELKRQEELLAQGEKVVQETRGWDEAKQKTFAQRSKEEAHDYRYFPEPDLPPFETKVFDLEKLKDLLPLLPVARRVNLKKISIENGYELNEKQIEFLIVNPRTARYFEEMNSEILELCDREVDVPGYKGKIGGYGDIATGTFLHNVSGRGYKYLVNDLQGLINSSEIWIEDAYTKVPPQNLAYLAFIVEPGGKLDESRALGREKVKEILKEMLETGAHPEDIIKFQDIATIMDDSELQLAVSEIVAENPGPAADYKKGKTQALQFLIGKAMARLKGRGDPKKLGELIERIIRSSEE